MSKQSGYHHGNLRDALIVAAVELIEHAGSADFTISEAAKRAGVSPAAPYRHFKDKDALLEAVGDLYFIGLAATSKSVREAHPPGSRDAIIALGEAYLRYVCNRAAFYDLIWNERADCMVPSREPDKDSGFYIFAEAVDEWCKQHAPPEVEALEIAVKLWAMAHGLSVLTINGRLSQFMPQADTADMLGSSANTFLDGVEKQA